MGRDVDCGWLFGGSVGAIRGVVRASTPCPDRIEWSSRVRVSSDVVSKETQASHV